MRQSKSPANSACDYRTKKATNAKTSPMTTLSTPKARKGLSRRSDDCVPTTVQLSDSEPNSVMEVIQRGYSLNGRLVRAAKVIVVKAPSGEESSSVDTSA